MKPVTKRNLLPNEARIMDNVIQINLVDVIGSPFCVSVADGLRLPHQILPQLQQQRHIVLSFTKANTVVTAFLNASYGKLFGSLTPQIIENQLQFEGIDTDLVRRIKDKAISYYQNPAQHQMAWDSVTRGEG